MLRLNFIFLTMLLGNLVLTSQIPTSWTKNHKMNGNVKSYRETYYIAEDKFGEIVKGNTILDHQYSLNSKGIIIQSVGFNDGTAVVRTNYEYDTKNNLITERSFNNSGILISLRKCVYDTRNNLISDTHYDDSGSIQFKTLYKYNSANQEIEKAYYKSSGTLIFKTITTYSSSGLVGYQTTTSSSGIEKRTIYFDSKGRVIKKDWKDSKNGYLTMYNYDSRGNVVKWEQTYHNSEYTQYNFTTIFTYVYDSDGNWTKKTDTTNGFTKYVTERKLTYN